MKWIKTACKEKGSGEISVKASGTYSNHCFEELTLENLHFDQKCIYFYDIHNKQRFYP
jgi:hypothetical protein